MSRRKQNLSIDSTIIINNDWDFDYYLHHSSLSEFKRHSENVDVELCLEDITNDEISKTRGVVNKCIRKGLNPSVIFEVSSLNITIEEIIKLIDFEDELNKKGAKLSLGDNIAEYTLDEVVNAKVNVEMFIAEVKKLGLSPFENFLVVYNYVTSRKYVENNVFKYKARNLVDVLNGSDIVCVGYANLMEYILNAFGVKCVSQHINVERVSGDDSGRHVINLVYLEDEKYGIKGWFYVDATWDCVNSKREPFLHYNYCLLPVEDVDFLKKDKIIFNGGIGDVLSGRKNKASFIDGVIFDYLESDSVIRELKMQNVVKAVLDDYREKAYKKRGLISASNKLIALLEKEGFPSDVFKDVAIPTECRFEFLLACILKGEEANAILERSFNLLKEYMLEIDKFSGVEFSKKYVAIDDYKEMLSRVGDKNLEKLADINIYDIEKSYVSLVVADILDKILPGEGESFEAITMESFRSGIQNINLKQGTTNAFAGRQAERAIDASVRRSEKIFKTGAKNCFKIEALKRRKEQEEENKKWEM